MDDLTNRELECAAIGAAVASNCIPCLNYHVRQARKASLTDAQIRQAIVLAEKVKNAPAKK